jgi:predicted  nucleic acid-binding Zn-ribbon protein
MGAGGIPPYPIAVSLKMLPDLPRMKITSQYCQRRKFEMRKSTTTCLLPHLFAVLLLLMSCQTVYYDTMEKFGYQKRDILVDRVEDARDTQQEAKDQFQSALEHFSTVVNFRGGELEEKYNKLNGELKRCESKAGAVSDRIAAVEDVAEALFAEWKEELAQYTNANLRRSSQRKLDQTRKRYQQLIGAMKRAEVKIDPVLAAFRDQVLFLKHDLNAQAIASLHQEMVSVEADIASLIKEMEASIAEADGFIKAMSKA